MSSGRTQHCLVGSAMERHAAGTFSFSTDLASEEMYKEEVIAVGGNLHIVDVYEKWCGPSRAGASMLKKVFLEGNPKLKFWRACSEAVESLKEHGGSCEPVFIIVKDGNVKGKVVGIDAPGIAKLVKEHAPPRE